MFNVWRVLYRVGGLSSLLSHLLTFWHGVSRRWCLSTRPVHVDDTSHQASVVSSCILQVLIVLTLHRNCRSFWSAAGDFCLLTNIWRLEIWHWWNPVLLSSLLTGYRGVMRDYYLLATHTLPQQQLICCLDLDVDRCARCDTIESNVKI